MSDPLAEYEALRDRLRGKYPIGPKLPSGEPEFGYRQFPVPNAIQIEAADAIDALLARTRASDHELALIRADVAEFQTDCSTPTFIMVRSMAAQVRALTRERDEAERKGIRMAAAWVDALGREAEKRSEKWRLSNEARHAEVSGIVATELGLAAHGLRKMADEGGIPSMTEERREGHSKLVYDKAEQQIKTVDPHEDEHARTVRTIHGNAAMLASMLRSAEMERDQFRAQRDEALALVLKLQGHLNEGARP